MSSSQSTETGGFDLHTTSGRLRISSVFVILVCGFLGVFAPVKLRSFVGSSVFTLAKAFGAGVVLGTAFIHVLPTAQSLMEEAVPSVEYPIAGLLALGAIVLVLAIEQVAAVVFAEAHDETEHSCEAGGPCVASGVTGPLPQEIGGMEVSIVDMSHQHGAGASSSTATGQRHSTDHRLESYGHRLHHHHQHSHVHTLGGSGGGKTKRGVSAAVIAHVLEVGISLHSVIIGMALGVTSSVSEVRALLIALSMHQLFEGVALGVNVVEAELKRPQRAVAVLTFTLATPVGIAIGIGLSAMRSESGNGLLLAQGVLDAISGGILVYMALVDMISDSFSEQFKHRFIRLAMLLFVVLGAAAMSIIGLWA